MKRFAFIFIIFFITKSVVFPQIDRFSDSLKKEIIKADSDTLRIKLMCVLSSHLTYQNNEQAEVFAKNALELSKKQNYKRGEMFALFAMANVNQFKGKLDKAVEFALQSLNIAEEINDTEGAGDAHNSLGLIYQTKNEFETANKHFTQAVKFLEKSNSKGKLARSMNNAGNSFYYLGDYDAALQHLETALLIRKETGNMGAIADSYNDIGNVYYSKGELDKGLSYYIECHRMKEKINDLEGISFSALNIAVVYKNKNQYNEARKYFEKSLDYARKINARELLMHNYQSLSGLSYLEKDYKKAYEYFTQYATVKDSMLNESSSRAIAEMKVKFDTEKKEKEILKLEKKKAEVEKEAAERRAEAEKEKAQRIKEEETSKIFKVAVVGLLVIAGIIFYISMQRKKTNQLLARQNSEITEQKLIIEEKNRDILASISYAQRIQHAILPPLRIVKEYLHDSFILYKPKDIVAGDFYFMEPVGNKIVFAAADCTGHGVPGALVSVVCANALNRVVKEFKLTDSALILNKVRDLVMETFEKSESEVKDGMDISLCVLDTGAREIFWSGANNPLWVVRNNAETVEEIKGDKQPIGLSYKTKPFTLHRIRLSEGDIIYLFTDGYEDQFGGDLSKGAGGKKFKASKMKQLFLSLKDQPMEIQRTAINEAFENWKGELEQIDDVCIIGVRL